jgi:hypothetical protein
MAYVQRKGSDIWHWMRNCSKFPKGTDADRRATIPPSGELCNECKAKEKDIWAGDILPLLTP